MNTSYDKQLILDFIEWMMLDIKEKDTEQPVSDNLTKLYEDEK